MRSREFLHADLGGAKDSTGSSFGRCFGTRNFSRNRPEYLLLSHSLGTDSITQSGIRGRCLKVFPLVLSVVQVAADDLSVTKCLPLDTLAQEEEADAAVVQGCSCSAVMFQTKVAKLIFHLTLV